MESFDPNEDATSRECFRNAARMLRTAEMQTDRDLMDRYDTIARSWIALGSILADAEVEG